MPEQSRKAHLAKTVLSNMATFHMQLQCFMKKTHKELDKAARQCIWGSSSSNKQIHLLSWVGLIVSA